MVEIVVLHLMLDQHIPTQMLEEFGNSDVMCATTM